ncbi:MAG: tRNA lysidine(34) synthetase TilS, partial [Polyangiales bacterium]
MITAQVKRTLEERALVEQGDHVLVACSGGPDSTALLHVLHRVREDVGITLCVASIDHGLRAESSAEVAQVGALASTLAIPFLSRALEISREGASLQGRAREARYAALRDLAAQARATRIAVGHTQDDQAETVLARLLRGAGIRGLRGIEPRRADGVIRPLLDCRRADVRQYAVTAAVPFVDDPTNHVRSFERVRLRHEVMPVLLGEDPRVVEHLAALADEAAALEVELDRDAPPLPTEGTRSIALDAIDLPDPVRARWLRRWISHETGLS